VWVLVQQDEALIATSCGGFQANQTSTPIPWEAARKHRRPSATALLKTGFPAGRGGARGAQASSGRRNRNALGGGGPPPPVFFFFCPQNLGRSSTGERFQDPGTGRPAPNASVSWRRGLQDVCLGLGREDFGPNSGIVLFERARCPDRRADRLEKNGGVAFIVIDAFRSRGRHPILQFPLWARFRRHRQRIGPRVRTSSETPRTSRPQPGPAMNALLPLVVMLTGFTVLGSIHSAGCGAAVWGEIDLRELGSGYSTGATNVLRQMGQGPGPGWCFLLDVLQGPARRRVLAKALLQRS